MSAPQAPCTLDELGVLRLHGPDACRFLQGQLSNDVAELAPGMLLRAGLHNPQGRTLALLAVFAWAEGDVGAILPRELVLPTAALLRRYVLRARVTLSDASADYRLVGHFGAPAAEPEIVALPWADGRVLRLLPATADATGANGPDGPWRAADIAAGLPQVHAATAGQFVAQMLNLDCIGAVSFTKGCYTGQEVIARAHYRGRVKRRLQRFATDALAPPPPGASVRGADGRVLRVIEAVGRAAGGCEFLAVAPLPGAAAEAGEEAAGPAVAVQSLPLPYPLPE